MNKTNNNSLWKYAGMATQFLVAIGLGVVIGLKLDQWLKFNVPIAAWVLPLVIIIGMIIKIMRDTAPKK